VVLVHGYGYTLREVAELTAIRPTTVQNHLSRRPSGGSAPESTAASAKS
jgi:hypothetical protein